MSARRTKPPEISIIMPTDGRTQALQRLLDSLSAQQDAPTFELLVSAPATDNLHDLVTGTFPKATIVTAEAGTAGERRNTLLPLASGELVLFLDDDVVVPPRYLATLADQARRYPEVDVFGGPNVTPEDSSRFQIVQGAVLSSLFGAGPVRRRYGARRATEADERWFTACNLAFRRTVSKAFDTDLVGAEENKLLDELHRSGARMRYDPALWAAHDRRSDLRGFAQQMFKYGRGRGQLSRRAPRSLRPAYLVPSTTLLVLLGLLIAAVATHNPWIAIPAAAYPLAIGAQSVKIAASLRRPTSIAGAFGLHLVMHGCYGVGLIAGLLQRPTRPQRTSAADQWRLLLVLVRRQLLLLRTRSVLGMLWPLLTPWVMLVLYSFVFHSVLNIPITRYHVFLFAGLLPWSFLAGTMGSSVTALSAEADLIRRNRFSYELLPLATEIAYSVYFLVTLVGFVGYLGVRGELAWATLPLIVIPIISLYLFVGAVACVLALVDVYNRDLRQVLNNILTVWFFLVPIVYRQNMLTHRLLFTRSIDPLNLIIGEFRDVLYYGHLSRPLHDVIAVFLIGALLLLTTTLVRRISPSLPKDV